MAGEMRNGFEMLDKPLVRTPASKNPKESRAVRIPKRNSP